ncbi:hypothetical protein EDC96DRAFT_561875 [Choanephora cucurbitarum]|nr:hypothetical protein EDC96DRAFT_561875 [Choanephora cucurbitarum]
MIEVLLCSETDRKMRALNVFLRMLDIFYLINSFCQLLLIKSFRFLFSKELMECVSEQRTVWRDTHTHPTRRHMASKERCASFLKSTESIEINIDKRTSHYADYI